MRDDWNIIEYIRGVRRSDWQYFLRMLALHPNDRLELYSGICSVTNNDWQEVEVAKTIFEILSRIWSIGLLLDRNAIGADESRTLWRQHTKRLCDVMPLWLSWSKWRKHVEQRLHSLEADVLSTPQQQVFFVLMGDHSRFPCRCYPHLSLQCCPRSCWSAVRRPTWKGATLW